MSSERFLFKVMVDRMESYRCVPLLPSVHVLSWISFVVSHSHDKRGEARYVLYQLTTFLYIPPMFCIVSYKATHGDLGENDGMEFSKFHFFVMGLLDLLHGLMLFIAGGRTDPTQTLLFMQASIPISACMSAAFFGVSVFYLLAAIPGSLSMLYKERVIRDQPVDVSYLNAWVSLSQFVSGLLVAPLIFDAEMGLPIFILYIFSSIVVNLLLLELLRLTSVSTMYGCTLAGFLASFVVLACYQVDPDNFGIIDLHDGLKNWIPSSVYVDVIAFMIIFAGKVLYQWDPDPEVEVTTLSAEDKETMSLLDGEDDYGLRYT
uniref:Uncharacterized protein n=1 Tax=Hyaloperonospora arabidopsidis (strain Emoy2) TaxID=559515 RepID=M4B3X2_HYAAE